MIAKFATGMARRGILKGALGLGAAVGLGGKVSHGLAPRGQGPTISSGMSEGFAQQGPMLNAPVSGALAREQPSWLKALEREGDDFRERESNRLRVDTLDIDLAALRGTSPAWRLVQQKARDKARRDAAMTLWERLEQGRKRWLEELLR